MVRLLLVVILLASSGSQVCSFRHVLQDLVENDAKIEDYLTSTGHISCPVLNALVQNGDLKTMGDNVDADTVLNSLMRAGLNQPGYEGEPLPDGMTQSNAFEYTLGIFLKNKAGDYRDEDGDLTLPIYNFFGTNQEHNSQTGITTKRGVPFDNDQWEKLMIQADSKLPNGSDCFSRDAWAVALRSFEILDYNSGSAIGKIDHSQVRSDHLIHASPASWGVRWVAGKLLKSHAEAGNAIAGKRLVASVSQVMNGMINLFWTGDYGNVELYKARAKHLGSEKGKAGLSFPWLDENFCLPVDELKELLVHGTYPESSGYAAMTDEEYQRTGMVWKFPKSRCTAAYFQEGHEGYEPENACINGEPPLIKKSASWFERTALHAFFGK